MKPHLTKPIRFIDVNQPSVPVASPQCYNDATLNKMTVSEDLLYKIKGQAIPGLVRARGLEGCLFPVTSPGRRGQGSPFSLRSEGCNHIPEDSALPKDPITSQMPHLVIPPARAVGFEHTNLGGYTHSVHGSNWGKPTYAPVISK